MGRGVLRRPNLTRDTLLTIAKLGMIVVAMQSPYFLHTVAKQYFKDKIKKDSQARAKKLRELQKRKLISFQGLGGGKVRIKLTQYGKKLVREYDLDTMALQKPKIWDRKWRVIIYDIPTRQKKASNALREKLRNLGLYQLQRSVWVSPYECLAEIEFLCAVFEINIDQCIYYFKTEEIPQEKELRKFFEL